MERGAGATGPAAMKRATWHRTADGIAGPTLRRSDRLVPETLASAVIQLGTELPRRLKAAAVDHIIHVWPRKTRNTVGLRVRGNGSARCAVLSAAGWRPRRVEQASVTCWPIRNCYRRIKGMKHLLTGVAVAAALAIAAPVWAQNPSGGNPMGTAGPNPGGPGMTPYSGGAPAAPPPAAMPAPAAASTSAAPPMHRHAHAMHHPMHGKMAHPVNGDTTAQLNREELSRIQSGNVSNPPPPAAPMPEPSPKYMPGPKPN